LPLGAMRLVEQGRIALDGDIQQYLSSWQIPSNGEWTPRIRQRLFELLGRNGLPDSRRARRRPSKIPLVVDNPQRLFGAALPRDPKKSRPLTAV